MADLNAAPAAEPGSALPPCVAITGASGSLGQALIRRWHDRGARLIALTSSSAPLTVADAGGLPIPLRQIVWSVGREEELAPLLRQVDVLVLNHGVNAPAARDAAALQRALEVNALSSWRLLELFAREVEGRRAAPAEGPAAPGAHASGSAPLRPAAELWLNTSEAEIQAALSPLYEISKRLAGQILSLRALDLADSAGGPLRIRRLVLGPFRSALNPIGVMGADWVAGQVLRQAVDWNLGLVIVTPNPLTYVLMPLTSLARWAYMRLTTRPENPTAPAAPAPGDA